MLNFQTTAVFFLVWMVLSTLGFIANLDSTSSDNFTNITESAFTVEGVSLDDAPIGSSSAGISSVVELPKTATGWIANIGKAATFQSVIWDGGFANIVRVILATIGGAYMLVLIVKGLEIVANIIPG